MTDRPHRRASRARHIAALRLAAALFSAVAAPAIVAPAAQAQAAISLPDPHEFREGDIWNAFAAAETQKNGMRTYYAYEMRHGRWTLSKIDLQSFMKPNPRTFTDLAGAQVPFPDHPTGFYAAPDGRLFISTNKPGVWGRVQIGRTMTLTKGQVINITERMTPAQAEAINQRFAAVSGGGPVMAQIDAGSSDPSASKPPARPAQPWYAARTTHCPDGHTFAVDWSKPADWRPNPLAMAVACAAVSGLPL